MLLRNPRGSIQACRLVGLRVEKEPVIGVWLGTNTGFAIADADPEAERPARQHAASPASND